MAKKDKGKQEGTSVPRSRIPVDVIDQKVRDGESNVISMYCYHFGDAEAKPPVEAKVCHKIDPKTFHCTVWAAGPAVKCRFLGHDEDGHGRLELENESRLHRQGGRRLRHRRRSNGWQGAHGRFPVVVHDQQPDGRRRPPL